MIQIRKISSNEKSIIDSVVSIHLETFEGFFLTFMGKGFLKLMYRSYSEYDDSGILVAFDGQSPVGFLAYSGNLSGLYKYMIKKRLIPFGLCALGAFLRKPSVFIRLIRAFLKPSETKREEKYMELASIGVKPDCKTSGIGSLLVDELKKITDFTEYEYITLETDALDNEAANKFYVKNNFVKIREFETNEGRKMFEYRFSGESK